MPSVADRIIQTLGTQLMEIFRLQTENEQLKAELAKIKATMQQEPTA